MWSTRTRIVGGAAAAVVAAAGVTGGVAVAHAQDTGSTPSATSTSPASPTSPQGKQGKQGKDGKHGVRADAVAHLKGLQHAQWVTTGNGKDGGYVTHDAIRGTVTAASATSVTVKAADGVSQTYAISGTTVVTLGQGKGTKPTKGAATDLKDGADVLVTGTGTTALTATRVVVPKG